MDTRELTPIAEAIENIEKRVAELNDMDELNNLWKSSCAAELLEQRKYLISLLPKVQEAIEEAYDEGYLDSTCENETPKRTTGNEYFTSKYKSNGETS